MGDEQRLARQLAAFLRWRYGLAAIKVATAKMRLYQAAGDAAAANHWAAAIDLLYQEPAQPAPREASLTDVLDGGVTKAVMDADGVERGELERTIADAQERIKSE